MGADQTRVCKDNQENTTFKNVRSIDDCSPRGLSLQRKANVANNTGIPNNLKNGVETLSGYSLDNVRVHYNSSKPAAVQAYAYTQGTDIHIAPGQERCLPHEAWHVTQQMSGRVSPTTSIGGVAVNDDASLEHEADVMGARASTLQGNSYATVSRKAWSSSSVRQNKMTSATVQRDEDDDKQVSKDVENFKSKTFNKEYTDLDYSHFNAEYSPSSHKLNVTLKVWYNGGDWGKDDQRKKNYEENVSKTWGDKYHINFKENRLASWKNKLENTDVSVEVKRASTESDAYFKIDAVDGTKINPETGEYYGSFVSPGYANLRESSLDDVNHATDGYRTLNPTAHETGHMFGLDDEYIVSGHNDGDHSTHYGLVEKAFDKAYADEHAVMHANTDSDDKRQGTSVMRNGDTVEKHHYVTFWDAMVKAIQSDPKNGYGTAASRVAPNQYEDWKIE